MANNITQNPWVIDTASPSLIWTGGAKISHIEYVGYTLDTNIAVIKNQAGQIICQLDGAADLEEVRSGKIGWVQGGIAVTQIDGNGIVRIFLEDK